MTEMMYLVGTFFMNPDLFLMKCLLPPIPIALPSSILAFDDAAFQTGLKLPGSRSDVVRTKSLSGPSPVGGALGGFESNAIQSLDEFELQACQYNLACAYAQLNQLAESINSLEKAFQAGFDNYATVRGDPDLDPIKKEKDFEKLMERYEPKKGFNPFGLFGGKS